MRDSDPRLRILDPALGPVADQVLAALDGAAISIEIGDDVQGSARVAAAAMAAMTARLFGSVRVHSAHIDGTALPSNWWGAKDMQEMADRGAALISPTPRGQTRTLTVAVGSVNNEKVDLGIGGGDYTAHIARHTVPVDRGEHHLGVHAAACLGISQLLGLILGELGVPVVEMDSEYRLDLLTHLPFPDSSNSTAFTEHIHSNPVDGIFAQRPDSTRPPIEIVFAGAGSVGSSAIALMATALAPAYTGGPPLPGLSVSIVDMDQFDPSRNPFRYPALSGNEHEGKAELLAERLRSAGLDAHGHACSIGSWTAQRTEPGVRGLLVSSVDTLSGRLEVADVIAEETLSLGVSGLLMHVQRERMDGSGACPFCDYVDSAPALTQAEVYAELTGLELARVLQLLHGVSQLTPDDVEIAVKAGKLSPDRGVQLSGRRLEDLVNKVYADAQIGTRHGDPALTVAFPHASWFAGVLAAVEVVKQLHRLPLLRGRADVDMAGLPPGALRLMPQDPSGRCVCHSGVRRSAYLRMYGSPLPTLD